MTKIVAMFIAVFLVLGVMLYFIVISLRIVIENINKKVNAFFIDKLKNFDDDFNGKIREIEKMEAYKEGLKKDIHSLEMEKNSLQTSKFFAPRPLIRDISIPLARYIDNDFFGDYKKAKKLLEMDKNQIIHTVLERNPYNGDMARFEAANSIKEKLNFEATYDLCTLYQQEQIDFLREVLVDVERELFEEYLSFINISGTQGERRFDILHFLNWNEQVINAQSPTLYAYVGDEEEDYTSEEDNILCGYDDNICEGVKIIYQNKLYNFSIYEARKKSEKIN